jgi:hypothetical protein
MHTRTAAAFLTGAFLTGALVTGALALVAASPGIASSSASTARTWTVQPGGDATAKSGLIKLTDTVTGKAGTCKSSKVAGNVKAGTGLPGTDIGSVTAAAFRGCTGPAKLPFTVTARVLPWQLNFTSYDPKTGVVRGTVTHIQVVLSGGACHAEVDGTADKTPDGVVSAAYSDGTGSLKFLGKGGNLHFWHVKNCAPLLNNGDPATFTGTYTITPRQLITSP